MDEDSPGKSPLDVGVGLHHLAVGVLPLHILFQRVLDNRDDSHKTLDCTFRFPRDVGEFYCVLRDNKVASNCYHRLSNFFDRQCGCGVHFPVSV